VQERKQMIRPLALLTVFLSVAACSSPTEPELELRLAYVTVDGSSPVLEVVAVSDRTVEITFDTFGAGCHRAGDTQVVVTGMAAVVTPYDYRPSVGTPCTRDLVTFRHSAVMEFPSSGTVTVTVQGLSDQDGPSESTVVSYQFYVEVE
jgi:hypothetical protein